MSTSTRYTETSRPHPIASRLMPIDKVYTVSNVVIIRSVYRVNVYTSLAD